MKTKDESFGRLLVAVFSIIALTVCIYAVFYNFIYQSINVFVEDTAIIEYGSSNDDVEQFFDKVQGDVVSIKNKVDVHSLGTQEVVVVVAKGAVIKEIPIEIEVRDTVAPIISLVSDTLTVKQGNDLNLLSNVISVIDNVDGEISYVDEALENGAYYTIVSDFNCNVVGDYEVRVLASDSNNNISDVNFTVTVLENEDSTKIVNMAYSLLGSPYILGANGPFAFDCSGFVQYLYSQIGFDLSRGSSTQLYDGKTVSYDDILPGDIISWGYNDDFATHSSLYVGDGKMIHAANNNDGVILSEVLFWENSSSTHIISVRRIR